MSFIAKKFENSEILKHPISIRIPVKTYQKNVGGVICFGCPLNWKFEKCHAGALYSGEQICFV